MEKKLKSLEILQNVVNRLSQNSFLLKGWSVVLLAALLALAANSERSQFAYLAFIPILAFWYLDAYFLYHEKLFRKLYDSVRTLDEEEIDFSMDLSSITDSKVSTATVFVSKTLLFFHGTLFVTLVSVVVILW